MAATFILMANCVNSIFSQMRRFVRRTSFPPQYKQDGKILHRLFNPLYGYTQHNTFPAAMQTNTKDIQVQL